MDAKDSCIDCPIYNLSDPEQRNKQLSAADLISISPSKMCGKVYSCLNDILTTCHGKPHQIEYPQANVILFQNGKNQPFSSCLVIWQACNLMTRRPFYEWRESGNNIFFDYHGRSGSLIFHLPRTRAEVADIDIRSMLIHLLLAACATQKNRPWEEEIIINDRVVCEFLGLHQRKDMSRFKKLLLIQSLMEQACELSVEVQWQQRGKIKSIHIPQAALWHIDTTYHIAKTEDGSPYLAGLSFKILTGQWSAYFLNQEKAKTKTAYNQYGWLPISFAPQVMHLWQRHEGAVVILLYLLFRLRVGDDLSAKVASLLKLIYGEAYLQSAWYNAEVRRKVISTFEADLEQLFFYGLKPIFDDSTYPEAMRPRWIDDQNIPDDPEEAIRYWAEESRESKIGINSKQKWIALLNASFKSFELPEDWRVQAPKSKSKPKVKTPIKSPPAPEITGEIIKQARLQLGISQRELSNLLHKSQSWIRDIESGRYKVKQKDIHLLASILKNLSHIDPLTKCAEFPTL
jgi:DNA-binding transcriptional regulator YiaG